MERILCAAIWYKDGYIHFYQPNGIDRGFVVCGYRHSNCIALFKAICCSNNIFNERQIPTVQGFLTSENRFVDRKEAYKIFEKQYPLEYKMDEFNDELFSEDLY